LAVKHCVVHIIGETRQSQTTFTEMLNEPGCTSYNLRNTSTTCDTYC